MLFCVESVQVTVPGDLNIVHVDSISASSKDELVVVIVLVY